MLDTDPDPDSNNIILSSIFIVLLVLLSAFFSATETAFSSVNKTRLKLKAQSGKKGAINALKLAENFDKLLSTILVGNNIVNITMSVLFNNVFEQAIPDNPAVSGIVSVAVSTAIVLTFGEITPKMIAKENAVSLCIVSGYPIKLIMYILYPITIIFSGLKFLLRKIFKSKEEVITEEELLSIVEEAQEDGSLDAQEKQLISSAIEFDDAEVEDILVPRVNVIAVPLDMPMEQIKKLFLEYNFSRMPVYSGTIDNFVGMIHNMDFFTALEKGETSIKNYVTPVAVATAHMKISSLLKSMQRQKVHMAIVVDEYGGNLGIVTLEDILEELVGEIWDEHDEVTEYFTQIDENNYVVDGRAELDDFFEKFGFDKEESEKYDSQTVSGWVSEQTGELPRKNLTFIYGPLTVTVDKITSHRIHTVKVKINPQPAPEDKDRDRDRDRDKDREKNVEPTENE